MMLTSKEFDALCLEYAMKRVAVSRTSREELVEIYPQVAVSLAQHMASLETSERLRRHHDYNLWSIRDLRTRALIGIYAMAMLTQPGHAALLDGAFDARDPDPAHVAASGEEIDAIYKWTVFAPGVAAAAIPLIADMLKSDKFRALDLYGNARTAAGRRIMLSVGFRPLGDPRVPHLYYYKRLASRMSMQLVAPVRVPPPPNKK